MSMLRRNLRALARLRWVGTALPVCAAVAWLGVGVAYGQPPPGPGVRAAGLSEAFVAVADDASAVYWNPAGLAVGGLFSSVVERVETDTETGDVAAQRFENRLLAVGVPSFGATYYRLSSRQAVAGLQASPEDGPAFVGPTTGVTLVTDHYGATILQSVTEGFVVGTTLRYVRGRAGRAVWPAGTPPADVVGDLATTGSTKGAFDLDVGVMVSIGSAFRVGYVGRNLVQPEFEVPEAEPVRLSRQHRVGVAILPAGEWVIAVDADLLSTTDEFGERQGVSTGVERWFYQKRFGVRGGFKVNARNSTQRSYSVGGSVKLGSRAFVESFYRTSDGETVSSWGIGARIGY
jgi:hypothetical protein